MMKISKPFLIALSVVFAASMALQICCHQDWSEIFAHEHQTEAAEHSHSHDHSKDASSKSECGPHKFKDLVQSDKLDATNSPLVSSFTVPIKDRVINDIPPLLKRVSIRLLFFNKAGPPIHLLNSVFLN